MTSSCKPCQCRDRPSEVMFQVHKSVFIGTTNPHCHIQKHWADRNAVGIVWPNKSCTTSCEENVHADYCCVDGNVSPALARALHSYSISFAEFLWRVANTWHVPRTTFTTLIDERKIEVYLLRILSDLRSCQMEVVVQVIQLKICTFGCCVVVRQVLQ